MHARRPTSNPDFILWCRFYRRPNRLTTLPYKGPNTIRSVSSSDLTKVYTRRKGIPEYALTKTPYWVGYSFKANRCTKWADIPAILGWDCGEKAIRTDFKKEGYARAARLKPPLSERNKQDRLAWAWEHIFWTDEQWFSVLWSDETWVKSGRHTRTRVTKKIGLEEVYHTNCVEGRHQRKIGWMFWGSISGKYGRYRGLF